MTDHERAGDATLAAILNMVSLMDGKLDKHMEHEEGEIEEIKDAMTAQISHLDKRLDTFMLNVNSYMEKQVVFERAFLKHTDGGPDLEGHRTDHEMRKETGEKWRRRYDAVVMAVMVSATVGALAWVGRLLWLGALQGPKP